MIRAFIFELLIYLSHTYHLFKPTEMNILTEKSQKTIVKLLQITF